MGDATAVLGVLLTAIAAWIGYRQLVATRLAAAPALITQIQLASGPLASDPVVVLTLRNSSATSPASEVRAEITLVSRSGRGVNDWSTTWRSPVVAPSSEVKLPLPAGLSEAHLTLSDFLMHYNYAEVKISGSHHGSHRRRMVTYRHSSMSLTQAARQGDIREA